MEDEAEHPAFPLPDFASQTHPSPRAGGETVKIFFLPFLSHLAYFPSLNLCRPPKFRPCRPPPPLVEGGRGRGNSLLITIFALPENPDGYRDGKSSVKLASINLLHPF